MATDQTPNHLPEEDPRVRLAGERTLLAWIRTGLSMMGFGFVVARFGLFLREITPPDRPLPSTTGLSVWIGAAMIILGVLVNGIAALQHYRFLSRIDRGEPYRPPAWSLGIVVALILAALGIGMTAYLFIVNS